MKNTKSKTTPAKKKKNNLLDGFEEVSLAIESKFSIVEIKMKNDWRWKVKMLVHKILPKSYHDYSIVLTYDEEPHLQTIADLEEDASELARNPSLLPDSDARAIKEIDEKIARERKYMQKMKRECKDIKFVTQTEEIKYKDGDTALLFRVLDTVVEPLNAQKFRLKDFKAILEPILNN